MKTIFLLLLTLFVLSGCTTQDKYQMLQQNKQFYAANPKNCPKIEIHKDNSITCYTEDLQFIRNEKSVSTSVVRLYRAKLKEKRLAAQQRATQLHRAEYYFSKIRLNPMLGHL